MGGFKEMVAADNQRVFLNADEHASRRSVIYDGETYEGISVVLSGLKEKDRRLMVLQSGNRDRAQGLYMVTSVLHCAISDLGGKQPEKGQRVKISDEDIPTFFHDFEIASSVCDMGVLRIELEAIDE